MKATPGEGSWTAEKVIAVIHKLAQETELPAHLLESNISGSDTVDALGIDSIGGVYLIERLEEVTGHLIPDDFLELTFSINEIAARLNRLIEEQGKDG